MPVYLRYGKIKGEVKEPGAYRGWIELQSIQWGVGRGISTPTGASASRESSHPSVNEIHVTKQLDSSSPLLQQEALNGEGVLAIIDLVDAHGSVYLRYELTGTMISSFSLSSGGDRPTESLLLNFTKVEFKKIPGTPPPK